MFQFAVLIPEALNFGNKLGSGRARGKGEGSGAGRGGGRGRGNSGDDGGVGSGGGDRVGLMLALLLDGRELERGLCAGFFPLRDFQHGLSKGRGGLRSGGGGAVEEGGGAVGTVGGVCGVRRDRGGKRDATRRPGEKISTPQQNHGNGCWGQGNYRKGFSTAAKRLAVLSLMNLEFWCANYGGGVSARG